jgi:lipopolysaccharide transport system ATP-binding protein
MTSSSWALRTAGLGKKYRLGHAPAGGTLRDKVVEWSTGLFRRDPRGPREVFWALRDVDFEVAPGESLGVIGRNGAGKSTLLKILSRITVPTQGEARIRGRLASLLEVGTGFHRELTGRENIFLNGAILGMRRAEISAQLDAIVEFADVGQFLDSPVKLYSSGMYLRLAFGVAAHLRTDVILVDEVLAVGDMGFQQKCLGKMREVATEEGRTILLVSHNMSAVRQLCTRTLYLARGRVEFLGETEQAMQRYLGDSSVSGAARLDFPPDKPAPCFEFLRLVTAGDIPVVDHEEPLVLELAFQLDRDYPDIDGTVSLWNTDTKLCTFILSRMLGRGRGQSRPFVRGRNIVRVTVPARLLLKGEYSLSLALYRTGEVFDFHQNVLQFQMVDSSSPFANVEVRPGAFLVSAEASCRVEPAGDTHA